MLREFSVDGFTFPRKVGSKVISKEEDGREEVMRGLLREKV